LESDVDRAAFGELWPFFAWESGERQEVRLRRSKSTQEDGIHGVTGKPGDGRRVAKRETP